MKWTELIWLVIMSVVLAADGVAQDDGKWLERNDTNTFVIFASSNITISVNGTQDVWMVSADKTSGLVVSRNGVTNKAVMVTKFNERIFQLGDRCWVLRKEGSGSPPAAPPGGWNQPEKLDNKK